MAGNVDESGGYTCQECGETLANGGELDSHMESEHPDLAERPERSDPAHRDDFVCEECDRRFDTEANLDEHQAEAH
ncbi:hypothetical protein BRD01_16205 [Halobacteriales archaeon QS_8_65_32]|nr:MAG: hypothetical protein BRD01_16205 [Halobacteriales archaeon QS_8_65_32]